MRGMFEGSLFGDPRPRLTLHLRRHHGLNPPGGHVINKPGNRKPRRNRRVGTQRLDIKRDRFIRIGNRERVEFRLRWACHAEVLRGDLVALLPEWSMAALPVHAYFPLGRATRLAARAFVEFITEALDADKP